MALSISGEGYETLRNMHRILCIELLIPSFRLKSLIHVLDRNVIGHVSARCERVACQAPCSQTHNGILLGIHNSKGEGKGEFKVATETDTIFYS